MTLQRDELVQQMRAGAKGGAFAGPADVLALIADRDAQKARADAAEAKVAEADAAAAVSAAYAGDDGHEALSEILTIIRARGKA